MSAYSLQIKLLLKRLSICYLVYFLCRFIFFLANKSSFAAVGPLDFLADCFWGLRFDTFSILISNGLFILLSALPLAAFYSSWYQKLLKWIFIIPNAIFILANCIDIGYFAYSKKRSGADLFNQVGGQTDMKELLPQYLKDFWWLLIIYLALLMLLVFLYNHSPLKRSGVSGVKSWKQTVAQYGIFIFMIGLTVLGIRGGWQRIPIDIVDAGGMVRPEEVAIVLNTPFTLIKSVDKKGLEEYHYYNEEELAEVYRPVHQFQDTQFLKSNVVVIILESFAKEYTKLGKTISYTPFLDSLMQHSLVFTNGFANGSKSIEGIPSILSSLPSLMENPVINSPYSNNYQTSFATILKPEGYETAFFHGGTNGTMNFDAYASLAGYENYFGRTEYNNDADFDGFWGIPDEPFLQYTVQKMDGFKEPFHSAIFTLSSHHPYIVPEKYKGKFPKGHLENSESVGYADYSLKLFFERAKKSSWYKNTLFVLAADHSSISEHPFYSNQAGQKAIPIMFFRGDNSLAGTSGMSFSQIDILPSVMDMLGYNKPFFSFGESFLNNSKGYCYFTDNGNNFLICDSLICCFKGGDLYSVSDLRSDSLMQKNLVNTLPLAEKQLCRDFRAFIQTYNHCLISNQGIVK